MKETVNPDAKNSLLKLQASTVIKGEKTWVEVEKQHVHVFPIT